MLGMIWNEITVNLKKKTKKGLNLCYFILAIFLVHVVEPCPLVCLLILNSGHVFTSTQVEKHLPPPPERSQMWWKIQVADIHLMHYAFHVLSRVTVARVWHYWNNKKKLTQTSMKRNLHVWVGSQQIWKEKLQKLLNHVYECSSAIRTVPDRQETPKLVAIQRLRAVKSCPLAQFKYNVSYQKTGQKIWHIHLWRRTSKCSRMLQPTSHVCFNFHFNWRRQEAIFGKSCSVQPCISIHRCLHKLNVLHSVYFQTPPRASHLPRVPCHSMMSGVESVMKQQQINIILKKTTNHWPVA